MFVALLFLALAAPLDPPKLSDEAAKELKTFDGKWTVVKEILSTGERESPQFNGKDIVVEFKDRKMMFGELSLFEIATLDPSTDPKCLDVKSLVDFGALKKGTTYESIYKFDGDTLTWVGYAGEDKKRPANFDAPKDALTGVLVLKRVK